MLGPLLPPLFGVHHLFPGTGTWLHCPPAVSRLGASPPTLHNNWLADYAGGGCVASEGGSCLAEGGGLPPPWLPQRSYLPRAGEASHLLALWPATCLLADPVALPLAQGGRIRSSGTLRCKQALGQITTKKAELAMCHPLLHYSIQSIFC